MNQFPIDIQTKIWKTYFSEHILFDLYRISCKAIFKDAAEEAIHWKICSILNAKIRNVYPRSLLFDVMYYNISDVHDYGIVDIFYDDHFTVINKAIMFIEQF